jgi:hypothetical protein
MLFFGLTIVFIVFLVYYDVNSMPFGKIYNWILMGSVLFSLLYYSWLTFRDYLKLRFDKNTCLKVTDQGIYHNIDILIRCTISWGEIEGFELRKVAKVPVLVIRLIDPEVFIMSQANWKRHFLRKYVKKMGSPVIVAQTRVVYDLGKLHQFLQERIEEMRVAAEV